MNSIPGRIQDGKPVINKLSWQGFTEANEGRWFDIIARKPKRSLSQNSYYWLYLNIVSGETGNEVNDLHEFFKTQFLPLKTIRIVGKTGEYEFHRATSTTELTKAEFGEYLDRIAAMTLVPPPDPQAAGYLPH